MRALFSRLGLSIHKTRVIRAARSFPIKHMLTYDKSFFMFALIACFVAFFIPFLYYPEDPSNPWPYAYNVIQSRIIASGQFQNLIPQFGAFVRLDYGWFALHHLTIVMFTLASGVSFSTQERILSFPLSVLFFLGFYQFAKVAFGNRLGFVASLFFLVIPRTYNYLPNVNGEFLSWLILFPALISFIAFAKSGRAKFAILSCILASALIITDLMVFAEYLLIVGSYLFSRAILSRDTKGLVAKMALFLLLAIAMIPLPILISSGNLVLGSSSTIGSLYSTRSATEARYESLYYQNYDWGWKLFASQMPLQVQLYYISNDGYYLSYLLLFFAPFAALGVISCILEIRKISNLFALTWLGASVASSSLLLSRIFNVTVIAASTRLLLYFAWPFSVMAGIGFAFVWTKLRYRWGKPSLGIFLVLLLAGGVYVGSLSAGLSNSEPRLYLPEYQDALNWLRTNTLPTDGIMTNDWTVGQVWMVSSRLSMTEGGVGSASYSTYQDIVTKLDDAYAILTSNNVTATISLMQKHNISWILVWNRPSALNIVPFEQVNFAKFLNPTVFSQAFSEERAYYDMPNNPFPSGTFTAKVDIFHLSGKGV